MEPPSFSSIITNIVDTPTDQMKRLFHNITLDHNSSNSNEQVNEKTTNKDKEEALEGRMKTKHLDDEFGNNRASKRIKRTTLFENVTIHQVAQDIDEQLGESTHTKLLNGIKQERHDVDDDHDDDDETIISNISCHSITPERLTAAVNIDWVTLGKLSNSQYLRHYKGQPEILRRGGIYISY